MTSRSAPALATTMLVSDGSACGDVEGGATAQPANDSDGPAEQLVATCGAVEFADIPADWSSFPAIDDIDGEVDLSAIEEERYTFDEHDWHIAMESDDELTLFGTPDEATAAQAPAGPGYASASFERDGDRWVPRGWGNCRIEVSAPGWGNARFVMDPDIEPDPASSTLAVLAWEIGCASGQPPDDRDVQPVVLATDGHSVEIVVLVEPVSGAAVCPGNPSFELEVDLGEPLADRSVFDASVDPPSERPWPPTQSSLDSGGRK